MHTAHLPAAEGCQRYPFSVPIGRCGRRLRQQRACRSTPFQRPTTSGGRGAIMSDSDTALTAKQQWYAPPPPAQKCFPFGAVDDGERAPGSARVWRQNSRNSLNRSQAMRAETSPPKHLLPAPKTVATNVLLCATFILPRVLLVQRGQLRVAEPCTGQGAA